MRLQVLLFFNDVKVDIHVLPGLGVYSFIL